MSTTEAGLSPWLVAASGRGRLRHIHGCRWWPGGRGRDDLLTVFCSAPAKAWARLPEDEAARLPICPTCDRLAGEAAVKEMEDVLALRRRAASAVSIMRQIARHGARYEIPLSINSIPTDDPPRVRAAQFLVREAVAFLADEVEATMLASPEAQDDETVRHYLGPRGRNPQDAVMRVVRVVREEAAALASEHPVIAEGFERAAERLLQPSCSGT